MLPQQEKITNTFSRYEIYWEALADKVRKSWILI